MSGLLTQPRYVLAWGKQVLKNEEVALIRFDISEADPGRNWTKSYWYDICYPEKTPFRGYQVIGRCDLRLGYSREIYFGGNIGYRIHAPFRGDHMAYKAAKLLIAYAKELGMPYVLITCNPDNVPSRKTLERLCTDVGGKMIDMLELPKDNEMYRQGDREKCVFYYPLSKDALEGNILLPNAETMETNRCLDFIAAKEQWMRQF